jgi:hypothetical protein
MSLRDDVANLTPDQRRALVASRYAALPLPDPFMVNDVSVEIVCVSTLWNALSVEVRIGTEIATRAFLYADPPIMDNLAESLIAMVAASVEGIA